MTNSCDSAQAAMHGANMIVARYPPAPPASDIAALLEKRLPAGVQLLGCGQTPAELAYLTEEQWASVDVLLVWGAKNPNATAFYAKLTGLRFALMCCHYFSRQLPRMLQVQAARRWEVFEVEELRGKTLGLVGCGHIGMRVAQLGHAYGMRVVALRSNPSLSQPDIDSGLLAQVYSPDQLHEVISCSDYIVVSTPYTPETHQVIDASAIAVMKSNAVLINVGQGRCIDEPALIAALQSGRIRGAGLDVFEVEPLPADSPLWGLPNVLIWPHCAAFHSSFRSDSLDLFVSNLERYLAGQPLLNVLDKQAQY